MKFVKQNLAVILLTVCVSCTDLACMEQYNSKPYWDQLRKEEAIANHPQPVLTEDGKLKEPL
jgi:hypothetical protein